MNLERDDAIAIHGPKDNPAIAESPRSAHSRSAKASKECATIWSGPMKPWPGAALRIFGEAQRSLRVYLQIVSLAGKPMAETHQPRFPHTSCIFHLDSEIYYRAATPSRESANGRSDGA